MSCRNGSCERYEGLRRKLRIAGSADEIRYARLWVELNLPKELQKRRS